MYINTMPSRCAISVDGYVAGARRVHDYFFRPFNSLSHLWFRAAFTPQGDRYQNEDSPCSIGDGSVLWFLIERSDISLNMPAKECHTQWTFRSSTSPPPQ
ncbi:hypothetical protein [Pseudomonas sp. W2-17]|uniref:hypothetical protein n=1 Tax=Pseudomonas sp. W2-17 TaxID=3058039 RepID=UPI0034E06FA7